MGTEAGFVQGLEGRAPGTDTLVAVATTDGVTWTWDELFREFGPALTAYARSRGIREADDVVQDVLVTVVHTIDDFEGDSDNLRSWLFTLAYRRIADRHRRFYRSPLLLVADHDPTPADQGALDKDLLDTEALDDAMAAFEILDDRQRQVLQLRIIEELTPSEVAERLGLRAGHVRVIQSRALSRIRSHLTSRATTLARSPGVAIVPILTLVRDMRTALPSDDVIGPWIDQVRAASSIGAAASGTAAAAAAAATATATTAGTGAAAVSSALAVKVGASVLGLAVAVGAGAAIVDRNDTTAPPVPAVTRPAPADDVDTGPSVDAATTDQVADRDQPSADPAPVLPPVVSRPAGDEATESDDASASSTSDDPTNSSDDGQPVADTVPSPSAVDDVVSDTATATDGLVSGVTDAVDEAVGDATGQVGGAVADSVDRVVDAVDDVASTVDDVESTVDDAVDDTVDTVDDIVDEVETGVGGGVDEIVDDTVPGVADDVDDAVGGAIGDVDDAVGGAIGGLGLPSPSASGDDDGPLGLG